ncbi:MAG: hypothetical protein RRY41_03175 [Burkholderiaceae bacterium]
MSQLQIALTGLALAVLVGIFAWGKWDERRARARMQDLHSGVGDPLMGESAASPAAPATPEGRPRSDARVEPSFGGAAPVSEPDSTPALTPESEPLANDVLASAPVQAGGWLEDPLLDFAFELRCSHPIDGVAALAAAAQLARLQLPLPAHLAVWDARVQQWSAPDRFGFYSEMLVALQMADRRGALTEIDASRFLAAVQQIALELEADFDPPDVPRLLEQAAALDATVAKFDVQLSLTLKSAGAPFAFDAIRSTAQAVGFVVAGEGRWEKGDAERRPLLLAADAPLAESVRITLDVPVAPLASQPLEALFATANDLAARLGALIVDDVGRPIASGAAVAINQQLALLYQQMHDAGIEPGGERARRLYTAGEAR